MYIVVTKKIKYIFMMMLLLSSVQVFGFDFKCFETSDTGDVKIKSIAIGLTTDIKQASSLVVFDNENNRESTELGCPLFPTTGDCGLMDDGGSLKLSGVSSDKTSIEVTIIGSLKIERVQPENYVYIKVDKSAGEEIRVLNLDVTHSADCDFFLDL